MHLLTFNLAFPSAALPASGSLGMISARCFMAPLVFWTYKGMRTFFTLTSFYGNTFFKGDEAEGNGEVG